MPHPAPIPYRRTPGRRRPLSDWLLAGEALAMLAIASAAIRLLPFRRVVALADRRDPTRRAAGAADAVARLVWVVEAVARRVPWRTVCFQKGLSLHLMLRRRGVASLLHYGVGRNEAAEFAAHVWISVDGDIVQGGDVVDGYRCLATYPAAG